MRFEDLFNSWTEKRLTQQEAAMMLGISERTFRRYCRSYEEQGLLGVTDNRLERKASNAAPVDEVMSLIELYETKYSDFSVAHFFDKYREEHVGKRSYNWVRLSLQEAGIVKISKKRGTHRRKRERSPMKGMLLHQDGSTHEWVPGKHWDLIITMDDATSDVYSGFFVEEEGTVKPPFNCSKPCFFHLLIWVA